MLYDASYTVVFYLLAALTLGSAGGVVLKRNLVHSAFLLALCFIGVAGLYLLLEADFLAAVQILVYSGAVAVMIAIGIMLTSKKSMADSNPPARLRWLGAIVAAAFTIIGVAAVTSTPWQLSAKPALDDTTPALAALMLSDYMLAFEAMAVLLLAAMIGAIILAKGASEA